MSEYWQKIGGCHPAKLLKRLFVKHAVHFKSPRFHPFVTVPYFDAMVCIAYRVFAFIPFHSAVKHPSLFTAGREGLKLSERIKVRFP
jgi:hypothetical protein